MVEIDVAGRDLLVIMLDLGVRLVPCYKVESDLTQNRFQSTFEALLLELLASAYRYHPWVENVILV